MGVITFRENIPINTPASAPVELRLVPMSRAIVSVTIWSSVGAVDNSKHGFRLLNGRRGLLIPDSGSWGVESFANPNEFAWAPIPNTPKEIAMFDQLIEGPPYALTLQAYNIDTGILQISGWILVRDPFAEIPAAQEYEILTNLGPKTKFVEETTQGLPMERGPAKKD